MAAAFLTQSIDDRTKLANALSKAGALVSTNVQSGPVNYSDDLVAALQSLQTLLTASLVGA